MPLPEMALSESVEGRVLEAVKAKLGALSLPGIPAERIVIQKLAWVPDEQALPTPYILVSPAPESTNWQEGTNETDTNIFGVVISVVLASNRQLVEGLPLQLYWRERIRRAFQNRAPRTFTDLTLATDAFFVHAYIESGDKFIEPAFRDMRDAQYFVARFKVKEPRE